MDLLTAFSFHIWSILAQSLIFGIALTLAIRLALAIVAPANASTRFAVWFLTLAAVAVMPAVLLVRAAAPLLDEHANANQRAAAPVYLPAVPQSIPAAAEISAPAKEESAPASESTASLPTPADEPERWFRTKLLIPDEIALGFLSIYPFIVALLLIRLGVSYLRLRRLKARTLEAPPELLMRLENWLALGGTARPVRLLLSTKARSPMAVGFSRPAIIIPDSLLLQLTGEELDHLGIHELAHIRRYDDWTNLAQRVIRAILFFHPAVHWLCRKLDFEREVACDDWVLTLTGSAKPYARSLTKILEFAPWQRGPVLASGAVFRKRQIFRRIEMMLDRSRDSRPRISSVTFLIVLLCVFGAFSEIVRLPSLIAFGSDGGSNHQRSTFNVNGREIEVRTRGDVQFGENDLVESIAPGGYFSVSESGWTPRKLELYPGNSSPLEARYLVDGWAHAFDERGREWAASTLAVVLRENGTNAEARAMRILAKHGASGLFDEIDRISSDNSRQKYLSAAIRSGKLKTEDLRRAMNQAGRISSDHDKSELLLEVVSFYRTDQLRGAYFDALNTIQSDSDRQRVLTQVIGEAGGDAVVLAHAGRSVEQMSSDHDKAELLQLLASQAAASGPAAQRSIMRAVESIGSDSDKANVLMQLLGSGALPPDMLEGVLRIAAKFGSDHEKAQVLELAAQKGLNQPNQQAAFFAAADTVQSSDDRARILNTFIERDGSGSILDDLAHSIEQISSDHDKAGVLTKLAARPATPAFLKAVRSINADSEKLGVIAAMMQGANSVEAAKNAIALAGSINSDSEKTQVLYAAATKYGNNAEVRDAVRKAAEKITSDTDYRRIVSTLFASSEEVARKRGE